MYRGEPGEISDRYQVANEGLLTLPFGIVRLSLLVALPRGFANEILLHSWCGQVIARRTSSGSHFRRSAGEGERSVAHLFLERGVTIESLVAGRVGLEVADVAVEHGGGSSGDQAYSREPVMEIAADISRPLRITMHDYGEYPVGEVFRIVPSLQLYFLG